MVRPRERYIQVQVSLGYSLQYLLSISLVRRVDQSAWYSTIRE